METNKYLGKWVVFQPSSRGPSHLPRVQVGIVVKETAKQLKCNESGPEGSRVYEHTIHKDNVITVVSENMVKPIRQYAMRTCNDYCKATANLYEQWQTAMLNFPR